MTTLSTEQLYQFKEWINKTYAFSLLDLEEVDKEEREGIREMYVNDRNDYLMILSHITENHGKTAYQLWECLDTVVRDKVPDYIIDYLEQFKEESENEEKKENDKTESDDPKDACGDCGCCDIYRNALNKLQKENDELQNLIKNR
jgi:hypothetical protein